MSGKGRSKRRPKPRRRVLVFLAIAAPLALLALTAAGGAVYFGSSCDLSSLHPVRQADSSLVYGANGSLIGVLPAVENRTAVPRDAISPWMPEATVAIEDRRFYEHGGVDPVGILRALVADVTAGRIVQGGSTITQELVRNLYLTHERTLRRKVVEACLAIKLARAWPKDRILTAYLNDVYYGNHAYGIQAAAETYFSVPADRLTLEQAALLAGLPQAPSYYDPLHNPSAALARRDEVLRALRRSGDIPAARYTAAVRDRSLHLRASPAYASREPYFVGYVENLLQQAYGAATVRAGGLRIYTTIRPRLQRAAVHALSEVLGSRGDPAGAIVSVDPSTGAIRAMAAVTPGMPGNEFNLVTTAERQPGSTFKPIALAAAVAEGMNPWATRYLSAPFYYAPLGWRVRTYDGTYAGPESVAAATLHSDNTVYARLALDVGAPTIASMAEKLGVRTQLEETPSLALGTGAVTPLDMASVYATLAAGGVYARPLAIRSVVFPGGGKVDASWGRVQRERVVPDWVAATVTHVLEENMLHGTGVGAHVPGRIDAGKTGTTDDYADAWFCGYTPSLEGTVWIGYPRAEIPMLDVHGAAVSGPTLPATAWRLFMEAALEGSPSLAFPSPLSVAQFAPWRGTHAYEAASAATTTVTSSP
ncbi:MAG TPA: transglycosylase domain-containing protein [Gaiellaceae bacterium]|nr:transglycosylase domain-containing protein [Gaiellaceae bacterium]